MLGTKTQKWANNCNQINGFLQFLHFCTCSTAMPKIRSLYYSCKITQCNYIQEYNELIH